MTRSRQPVAERFWAKVAKADGDGCWEWQASTRNGYGQFTLEVGAVTYAHRFSYEKAIGAVPDGMCVLHRCDNRRCVRPDHLFLGTKADNAEDMVAKGRALTGDRNPSRTAPERLSRGSRNGAARLTEADVAEIRQRVLGGESRGSLARAFGVARMTISRAVSGESWRHV